MLTFYYTVFASGVVAKLSQMPIVLIPIHFDRDPINHIPSCQRSVVIRTFITNDFMTGIAATPGKQISFEVQFCYKKILVCALCTHQIEALTSPPHWAYPEHLAPFLAREGGREFDHHS